MENDWKELKDLIGDRMVKKEKGERIWGSFWGRSSKRKKWGFLFPRRLRDEPGEEAAEMNGSG
jgi:hypothetical protein